MSAGSRIAWVATPAHSTEVRGGQGTLDGEAISERLGQDDVGLEVRGLDPADDLAGQIDDWGADSPEPASLSLLYVSAPLLSDEGEVLLCLDPADPTTGDGLADVLDSLVDVTEGAVVVVLDLRAPRESDAVSLARFVADVRAIARAQEGVELLVAVRGATEDDAQACSPLTRAVLDTLEDVDPAEGLTAAELYERVSESNFLLGAQLAFGAVTLDPSALLVAPDARLAAGSSERPGASAVDVAHDEGVAVTVGPVDEDAVDDVAEPGSDGARREGAAADTSEGVEAAAEVRASTATTEPAQEERGAVEIRASVPPARPSLSEPPPSRRSVVPTAASEAEGGDRLVAEGDDEGALAAYRRALGLIGPSTGDVADPAALRASLHVRIGEAKLRQGKSREAVASFEKALGLSPVPQEVDRVLKLLLSIYLGERDHRSAASVQARLLERVTSTAERVATLSSFARSWITDFDEPLRARSLLDEARALAPEDRDVLRALLSLAERDARVDDVVELRRSLATLEPDPVVRAAGLLALGRELLGPLKRDDEALGVLEAALDVHPSELEPLVVLAQALADRQEWSELEGAYHRMLERLPRVEPAHVHAAVEAEIAKRLGLLLRDHLEDEAGALAAFERAIAAAPGDVETRRLACELARAAGEHRRALVHAQRIAERSPGSASDLRRLFDLLMKCDEIERACHVAEVLVVLDEAGERERLLLEAHRDDVRRPVEELPPDAWERLWPEEQLPVGRMFEAAGEALQAGLVELWRRAGELEGVGDAKAVDPATTTVSAPRSLAWAAKMLRQSVPQVFVDDAVDVAFRAPRRDAPTTIIGAPGLRGRTLEELSFLAGYHVASLLPAHRPVFASRRLDELGACFLAAVRQVVPESAVPEGLASMVAVLSAALDAHLDEDDRQALDVAYIELDEQGGQVDLAAWSEASERAALAAGLLLSGDLRVARGALEHLPAGPSAERRFELLLSVAVSEAYSDLRLRMSGAAASG